MTRTPTIHEEEILRDIFRQYNRDVAMNYVNFQLINDNNPENPLSRFRGELYRILIIINGSLSKSLIHPNIKQKMENSYFTFCNHFLSRNNPFYTNKILKTKNIIPILITEFLNHFYRGNIITVNETMINTLINNHATSTLYLFRNELNSISYRIDIPDPTSIEYNIINVISEYWYECRTINSERKSFELLVKQLTNLNMDQFLPSIAMTIYHHPCDSSCIYFHQYNKKYGLNTANPSYYMRSLPHDNFHRITLDNLFKNKNFKARQRIRIFGDIFENTIDFCDVIDGKYSTHIWPRENQGNNQNDNIDDDRSKFENGYSQLFFITTFAKLTFEMIQTVLPDIIKCYGGKCFQNCYHWHYVVFTKLPHSIKNVSQQMTDESIKENFPGEDRHVNVEKVYTNFHTCVDYIFSQIIQTDEDYTNYNNSFMFFDDPQIKCINVYKGNNFRMNCEEVTNGLYLPTFPSRVIHNILIDKYSKFLKQYDNVHFYNQVLIIENGNQAICNHYARLISGGKFYTLDISKQSILITSFRYPPLSYYFHSVVLLIGPKDTVIALKNNIIQRKYPWNNVEVVILMPSNE